jgi:hypothetical protein
MSKTKITFEEFCKKHNVDSTLPEITNVSEEVKNQMIATYKWELIIKTLNNEGLEKEWTPDYSDDSQRKYEIYVYYTPSSGWSLYDVDYWHSHTCCGARRVFRTREIGKYAGENLLDFYIATF